MGPQRDGEAQGGVTKASQESWGGPSLSCHEPTHPLGRVHLLKHSPTPHFPALWFFIFSGTFHLMTQILGHTSVPDKLEWSPYEWVSAHQLPSPQTWNDSLCLSWLSK